ncbi:MAG: orotidine-5'-phosphate decarboxylase [Bacteroidota bacterium]
MTRPELVQLIRAKRSFLCVGLDSDISKIPAHLLDSEDPVFEFNRAIIDATLPFTIAYKPNLAFYESRGLKGWQSLEKTMNYLAAFRKEVFTIADAKRGDIGNTSEQYAKAFLDVLSFDSVTVAPYMGEDSVTPFMKMDGKWVILLALTSNKGAFDFQLNPIYTPEGEPLGRLFEEVLRKSSSWGSADNMMYVVGATQAEKLTEVRAIVPDHFLLIPGVGAQGGSLEEVAKYGMNKQCGLLVNSSRNIIFASGAQDFAVAAGKAAGEIASEMDLLLKKKGL